MARTMLTSAVMRDVQDRGRDISGIIKQWFAFVKPNFEKVTRPFCPGRWPSLSDGSTLIHNGKWPISSSHGALRTALQCVSLAVSKLSVF